MPVAIYVGSGGSINLNPTYLGGSGQGSSSSVRTMSVSGLTVGKKYMVVCSFGQNRRNITQVTCTGLITSYEFIHDNTMAWTQQYIAIGVASDTTVKLDWNYNSANISMSVFEL